jgi:hypothetical protein
LSCMTSQCLSDRRIGDLATLQSEIAAWSTRVNEKQRAVDWQWVQLNLQHVCHATLGKGKGWFVRILWRLPSARQVWVLR